MGLSEEQKAKKREAAGVFKDQYKSHNLKKTISACILAHKKTSNSLTVDQAKVLCEKEINNMVDNSK